MNLTPETIVAIKKYLDSLKSTSVNTGTHQVKEKILIEVDAVVKKFPDETYTPTVSIPLKSVMAILLHLCGFQRERASEILVKAMTMAINNQLDANEEIQSLLKDIDSCMARVEEVTSSLPPKTRTGKTTVNINSANISSFNSLQNFDKVI